LIEPDRECKILFVHRIRQDIEVDLEVVQTPVGTLAYPPIWLKLCEPSLISIFMHKSA